MPRHARSLPVDLSADKRSLRYFSPETIQVIVDYLRRIQEK